MQKSYKASNFLDVIDKYTKRQRAKTIEEVKRQEQLEIKKAEEEVIEDVNNRLNKELIEMKNKISIEVSRTELEERKKFYRRRKEIMKDMIKECRKRLIEYSFSEDYKQSLKQYAHEISKTLSSNDVILYIKEDDSKYIDIIREGFKNKCEIAVAKDIIIGGIRGFSESKRLIADETLDAKLKEQEDWAAKEFGILLV